MSDNNYHMGNLGNIAIIIIIAFTAAVIYKLFKHSGHGVIAVITVALIILPALSRTFWFINYQLLFDIIFMGWILILIILLVKYASINNSPSPFYYPKTKYKEPIFQDEPDSADEEINRMYRFRNLSENISKKLRQLPKPSELLGDKKQSTNLLIQLQRILPEQGFLINRMAELRAKVHMVKNGHIAKIKEIRKLYKLIPNHQKREVSKHMIEYYRNETDFEKRLERLESLVTAAEKQNSELMANAKACVERHKFKEFDHIVHKAQRLQDHITHIIKIIIRTEKKLSEAAHKIVQENIK